MLGLAPDLIPADWQDGTLPELVLAAAACAALFELARRARGPLRRIRSAFHRWEQIPELADELGDLRSHTAATASSVAELRTELTARDDKLEARLVGIDARIDTTDGRIERHLATEEREIGEVWNRLAGGEYRMAQTEATVSRVEGKLDVLLGLHGVGRRADDAPVELAPSPVAASSSQSNARSPDVDGDVDETPGPAGPTTHEGNPP